MAYHDHEWGVPSFDEGHLFAMLLLEGQQAGLSWLTVLKKRAAIRAALADFDPVRLAAFDAHDIDRLTRNPAIIRNRAKLEAAVHNARAWLALREGGSSLAELLWNVVDGKPRQNAWQGQEDIPAHTPESTRLARALAQHGFRFVGPTVCYAYMQAVGLVNDHLLACFRHAEVARLAP